ncbi:MAG: 3-hydroxyacyl-CoA dehydrogenase/enoyl-CoA hydratase family protein, partial [Alphaproteobacteria bacterium]|nr:3-hydroxyacyl-CoA dehydrogenase/enoyl-CoA hydratase family protein [Alphaproteobacteria bacterium]
HFFNPPRYMRLLELVVGKETRADAVDTIRAFADIHLGKGVVDCKDSPGFIANRIGVFWLTCGLLEAIRLGITVEEADAVMGKPVGIPKTGVFGLFDLIGIDLMPLIAKELSDTLPKSDPFCVMYKLPELVQKMIADGYTGRKGKGGFYRINKEDGKKSKETIDLKSGRFRATQKAKLESADAAKAGLNALVTHKDLGGQYAWAVLSQTLAYAASLVPEISDDLVSVDEAMKLGYNWKYGPFELIDRLKTATQSGPAWFSEALAKDGKSVPALVKQAGNGAFYQDGKTGREYLSGTGYAAIKVPADAWMLREKTYGQKPIYKNGSAKLWDIGDGICCLEFTSKMNSIDPETLKAIAKSTEIVAKDYKGLVIGNDGDNFSVGANIGFLLYSANMAGWKIIEDVVKQGQDAMMGLKYAPFPVVTATSGMVLGGGCEVALHSDAIQAHLETYIGLVEVGVGLIPGWGGCKEMLLRHIAAGRKKLIGGGAMFAVAQSFEKIGMAKVAESADEAREMLILNDKSRVSMNRRRVLPDAKALCLELAKGYRPPEPATLKLPGAAARVALIMALKGFKMSGKATEYDVVVGTELAHVLSGSKADIVDELTEQDVLDLEREHFAKLLRNPGTLARVEHMLNTGKPLRN